MAQWYPTREILRFGRVWSQKRRQWSTPQVPYVQCGCTNVCRACGKHNVLNLFCPFAVGGELRAVSTVPKRNDPLDRSCSRVCSRVPSRTFRRAYSPVPRDRLRMPGGTLACSQRTALVFPAERTIPKLTCRPLLLANVWCNDTNTHSELFSC